MKEAKTGTLEDFHAEKIKQTKKRLSIVGQTTELKLDELKKHGPIKAIGTDSIFTE